MFTAGPRDPFDFSESRDTQDVVGNHAGVVVGVLRCGNSILVGGGDIDEYVAGVLFADDLGARAKAAQSLVETPNR